MKATREMSVYRLLENIGAMDRNGNGEESAEEGDAERLTVTDKRRQR